MGWSASDQHQKLLKQTLYEAKLQDKMSFVGAT
jgi:hypothetical protein